MKRSPYRNHKIHIELVGVPLMVIVIGFHRLYLSSHTRWTQIPFRPDCHTIRVLEKLMEKYTKYIREKDISVAHWCFCLIDRLNNCIGCRNTAFDIWNLSCTLTLVHTGQYPLNAREKSIINSINIPRVQYPRISDVLLLTIGTIPDTITDRLHSIFTATVS